MVVLLPHTAGRHASSWSWYTYSVRSRVDLLTRSIYISHVLRCEGREHIHKQDLGDLYIIRAPPLYGTPVSGSQAPPSMKLFTVNLAALDAFFMLWKPAQLTRPRTSAPGPWFSNSAKKTVRVAVTLLFQGNHPVHKGCTMASMWQWMKITRAYGCHGRPRYVSTPRRSSRCIPET